MRVYEVSESFGLSHLKLNGRKEPSLKRGEVRVLVHACSLNYRDLMVVSGIYNKNQPLPLIPVSDGAGEVVEVGPEVSEVKVGDRVCATLSQDWLCGPPNKRAHRSTLGSPLDGMLSESVVLKEEGVIRFPEHLTYEEASTLPCAGVTAFSALAMECSLKPGQNVLLLGTGGVSIFGLQIAHVMGAQIIITSKSDEKLSRAKELGAHHVINYEKNPRWSEEVRALTRGEGVDVVLEVGGAGTLEESIKSTTMGGQINLIGVLAQPPKALNIVGVLMNQIRVQGIFVGSKAVFAALNQCISLHKMKPVIDRVFPFSEAVSAFHYMEQGKHFGKVCIKIQE